MFGAPHVEGAQAVVLDMVRKCLIDAVVREVSLVVCALCVALSTRLAACTVRDESQLGAMLAIAARGGAKPLWHLRRSPPW